MASSLQDKEETANPTDFSAFTSNRNDVLEEDVLIQHRIFLNQVDTYNSRHLSSYLVDQIYGSKGPAADMDEMGEAEAEQEDETGKESTQAISEKYEIVGTLCKSFHQKSEDVLMVIDEQPKEQFMENVMKCGFIIYDITQDPGEIPKALATLNAVIEVIEKRKELGPKTFALSSDLRVFVLISTVLTWAKTKPIDPEEPDLPFTDVDYRKRRPHPNYKDHIACEREVILKGRKYKDKLRTYVIASGIVYGEDEGDLDFLFKMAWRNLELPLCDSGKNVVPFIHIKDLAKVIRGVLESKPKKKHYILAVEPNPTQFKNVVKSLSKLMGCNKIKSVTAEEAFLYPELSQKHYDRCTLNIHVEPGFIVETLAVNFENDLNLAENMSTIIEEFRKAHQLKPIKIVMHGPPAVGKTRIANQLCTKYGIHYVNPKVAIDAAIENLRTKLESIRAKATKEEEEETVEAQEEEEQDVEEEQEEEMSEEEIMQQLNDIQSRIAESHDGKLPDEDVTRLVKECLLKNNCSNQGYVLDGWPKTVQQAKELFGGEDDDGVAEQEAAEEEEEEEQGTNSKPIKIAPDYVFSLQASDEFLCQRIMQLPEEQIQGTHYEEEGMLRRLAYFRDNNTEDNTLLNFFDELEVHPVLIDVMQDSSETMTEVLNVVLEKVGKPVGFGRTAEEEEELIRLEEERNLSMEKDRKMKEELLLIEAEEERQRKMEEWADLLEQLQAEEEKILVAEGEPLRHYLMKFVFPTLIRGLLEVVRVKPEDPVDFLAEFLFRTNAEGRMFNPAYTRAGERITDAFLKDVEGKFNESEVEVETFRCILLLVSMLKVAASTGSLLEREEECSNAQI